MTNLMTAHREWATRPADERFRTFDDLETAVASRRSRSHSAIWDLANTRIGVDRTGDLRLVGSQVYEGARFSNWSFGQFTRRVGAPADFVSDLPAPMAADILNHRIRQSAKEKRKIQVLVQDGSVGREFRIY